MHDTAMSKQLCGTMPCAIQCNHVASMCSSTTTYIFNLQFETCSPLQCSHLLTEKGICETQYMLTLVAPGSYLYICICVLSKTWSVPQLALVSNLYQSKKKFCSRSKIRLQYYSMHDTY